MAVVFIMQSHIRTFTVTIFSPPPRPPRHPNLAHHLDFPLNISKSQFRKAFLVLDRELHHVSILDNDVEELRAEGLKTMVL